MRAWAEMFDAFLAGWSGPGRHRPPYTDADYFAHVDGKPRYDGVRDFLAARGIDLPEGDAERPARRRHGLRARQPQERRLQRRCSSATASRPTRARSRLLDRAARPAACRSPSSRRRPTPPPCSRRPGSPTASPPSSTAGSPPRSGSPGKPAPDTFVHAATELRRQPGHGGRRSRTPSRACGPGRRAASASSSASTAAPAPTTLTAAGADPRRRRPRRAGPDEAPRRASARPARPQPLPRRPVAPGRVRLRPHATSASPRPSSRVANGYLGMRGNPEEGRDAYAHGTFVNGFHETWPIRHAEDGLRLRPAPARRSSTSPTPS